MSHGEPIPRIAKFEDSADILRAVEEYRAIVEAAHQKYGYGLFEAQLEAQAYERNLGSSFVNEALAFATIRGMTIERIVDDEKCNPVEARQTWENRVIQDAPLWVDEARNVAMWDNFEAQFEATTTGFESSQQ